MSINEYQDPARAPKERPALDAMHPDTGALHRAIDDAIRRRGVPYLNPDGETLQVDLLGSPGMVAWQEGKAAMTFAGDNCWSGQAQIYARYVTVTTRALIELQSRSPGKNGPLRFSIFSNQAIDSANWL